MSEERCPSCGALVGAEAEWCGQCLRPLRPAAGPTEPPPEPAPSVEPPEPGGEAVTPPATPDGEPRGPEGPGADSGAGALEGARGPARRGVFGQVGDRMVWTCPRCELENPLDTSVCERCGTPFASLFREPPQRPDVPPMRAARLSLLFPGVGHMASGQVAEGVARAVLFAWVLASTIGLALVGGGGSSRISLPFLLLYALATAGLYVVSAVDAHRAAESSPPLAPIRILFYVASGLMAVTAGVLLFSGLTRGG